MRRMLFAVLLLLAGISLTIPLFAIGKPPKGIHPVVDRLLGTGLLMGGSIDGAWVSDETIRGKLTGKEQYRLYSATKFLGTATGSKAEDVPESSFQINLDAPKGLGKQPLVIGICGDWNALPRVPREQSAKQPAYENIVKDLLTRKGLPDARVNITRIWRVDLEGDGTEEVLIHAMTDRKRYGDELTSARKNDYSMVLLRKVSKGKAITIPVELNYYPADAAEGNGPSLRYTLEAVLDVNGDGVLEVITGDHAALWGGRTVYSVIGETVKARMQSYNGA